MIKQKMNKFNPNSIVGQMISLSIKEQFQQHKFEIETTKRKICQQEINIQTQKMFIQSTRGLESNLKDVSNNSIQESHDSSRISADAIKLSTTNNDNERFDSSPVNQIIISTLKNINIIDQTPTNKSNQSIDNHTNTYNDKGAHNSSKSTPNFLKTQENHFQHLNSTPNLSRNFNNIPHFNKDFTSCASDLAQHSTADTIKKTITNKLPLITEEANNTPYAKYINTTLEYNENNEIQTSLDATHDNQDPQNDTTWFVKHKVEKPGSYDTINEDVISMTLPDDNILTQNPININKCNEQDIGASLKSNPNHSQTLENNSQHISTTSNISRNLYTINTINNNFASISNAAQPASPDPEISQTAKLPHITHKTQSLFSLSPNRNFCIFERDSESKSNNDDSYEDNDIYSKQNSHNIHQQSSRCMQEDSYKIQSNYSRITHHDKNTELLQSKVQKKEKDITIINIDSPNSTNSNAISNTSKPNLISDLNNDYHQKISTKHTPYKQPYFYITNTNQSVVSNTDSISDDNENSIDISHIKNNQINSTSANHIIEKDDASQDEQKETNNATKPLLNTMTQNKQINDEQTLDIFAIHTRRPNVAIYTPEHIKESNKLLYKSEHYPLSPKSPGHKHHKSLETFKIKPITTYNKDHEVSSAFIEQKLNNKLNTIHQHSVVEDKKHQHSINSYNSPSHLSKSLQIQTRNLDALTIQTPAILNHNIYDNQYIHSPSHLSHLSHLTYKIPESHNMSPTIKGKKFFFQHNDDQTSNTQTFSENYDYMPGEHIMNIGKKSMISIPKIDRDSILEHHEYISPRKSAYSTKNLSLNTKGLLYKENSLTNLCLRDKIILDLGEDKVKIKSTGDLQKVLQKPENPEYCLNQSTIDRISRMNPLEKEYTINAIQIKTGLRGPFLKGMWDTVVKVPLKKIQSAFNSMAPDHLQQEASKAWVNSLHPEDHKLDQEFLQELLGDDYHNLPQDSPY